MFSEKKFFFWKHLRKIGIGKRKLLLSTDQVPSGGKALQWSSAKWSSAPTDRYIDGIHVFFSIPVCHHTHIGSEEKSGFSFLCSYLSFDFFKILLSCSLDIFTVGAACHLLSHRRHWLADHQIASVIWALDMYLSVRALQNQDPGSIYQNIYGPK